MKDVQKILNKKRMTIISWNVGGASVSSSPAFTNTGDDARVPEGYLKISSTEIWRNKIHFLSSLLSFQSKQTFS